MATVTISRRAIKLGRNSADRANDWDDLVTLVNKLVTLTQELKDDHATFKTVVDELKADHNATLAKLDADAGVADTDYAALYSTAASAPATLSAASPDTLATTR